MPEPVTVARPYAKAAFASAGDRAGTWKDALALLAQACAAEPLRTLLADPLVARERKAQAFIQLAEAQEDGLLSGFLRTLAANGRLALLPEVSRLFEEYEARSRQAIDVVVESAQALDEEQGEALAAAIRSHSQGPVTLTLEENPELIGGAIVRMGDSVIDGSLRGRLRHLAERLSAG